MQPAKANELEPGSACLHSFRSKHRFFLFFSLFFEARFFLRREVRMKEKIETTSCGMIDAGSAVFSFFRRVEVSFRKIPKRSEKFYTEARV